MKKGKTKQENAYMLDLTKTDAEGDFLCPRCGTKISPDDTTEEIYTVIEAKVNSCGLEELLIRCTICESEIHLIGFSITQESFEKEEKKCDRKKETICYVDHL